VRLESKHLEVIRRETPTDEVTSSRMNVPLHDLDRVVVVGRPNVTIPVLQRLMIEGIPCFFVTRYGRWIGSMSPDNNKNAARRIRQYQFAGNAEFSLKIARAIVKAKIINSRRVLQRLAANRGESGDSEQADVANRMRQMAEHVERVGTVDEVRGYEGIAASLYYARLGQFFPENIPFKERSRRPPRDPANALLSWCYTILAGEFEGTVRAHGLDACIGFLHELEHGRPSLALDLIEPFRAPICDLLALNLLNHRVLQEEHFQYDEETGGFILTQDAHKKFFYAYENAMTRRFTLKPGEPHTDFRRELDNAVLVLLRAFESGGETSFFQMP
jgi:CRISPR-associated protein Cas1